MNDDFYQSDEQKNIFQFKTVDENNQNNNQNYNPNNGQNNNQNNGQYDPLGIANEELIYQQGVNNEEVIKSVYKMPTRLLVVLVMFGALVVIGLILILIGISSDKDDFCTVMGVVFGGMGGLCLICFLPMILKNKKMNNNISREVLIQELSKPHYYLKPVKTYFTENYLICLFANKIITPYSNITWLYDEFGNNANQGLIGMAVNGKLGNTNMVVVLNNKKKNRFPSAKNTDSIYKIITQKNNNIIIGKSKESKAQFKASVYNPVNNKPQNNVNNNQSDNTDSYNNFYNQQ